MLGEWVGVVSGCSEGCTHNLMVHVCPVRTETVQLVPQDHRWQAVVKGSAGPQPFQVLQTLTHVWHVI